MLGEDPIAAWIDACVEVRPIVNGGPLSPPATPTCASSTWALAEGYKPEKLPAINGFVQRVQAHVAGIEHKPHQDGRRFLGLTIVRQHRRLGGDAG